MKKIILGVLLSCTLMASHVALALGFTIEDIRIEGLQRLSSSQAFAELPLKVGDTADERTLAYATRTLFKSGFFEDIRLEQEGNLLLRSQPSPLGGVRPAQRGISTLKVALSRPPFHGA